MNDKKNVRMCICCREMLPKSSLTRVFSKDGITDVDFSGKMGGRGAYICSGGCFLKAYKTGRISRALNCHLSEDTYHKLESVFTDEQ